MASIHLHHWRGRKIHSPFMYGVVRGVFMQHSLIRDEHELYDELRKIGISQKNAVILQNLYIHCHLENYFIADEDSKITDIPESSKKGPNLCILFSSVSPIVAFETARQMEHGKGVLAAVYPHRNTSWRKISARIWDEFRCVSVDRRLLRLYFFDSKLQCQHYRI